MNWTTLFKMQKDLDDHIKERHHLQQKNVLEEKYLALLVELGELANETRCFKFWSTKKQGPTTRILEEYVDGIHFLLSLGLEHRYKYEDTNLMQPKNQTLTEQFNDVFALSLRFRQEPTKQHYEQLFSCYLQLGTMLGFKAEDIQEAYIKKNAINFDRQHKGY